MKQRHVIVVALVVLVVLMIGLNTASYVRRVKQPDSEATPNRSTYHPGATGSLAFYTLLSETGRQVTRWQVPIEKLTSNSAGGPATFVMIGPFRKEPSNSEYTHLLNWVAEGGRLVVIDREPPTRLIQTMYNRELNVGYAQTADILLADPADRVAMTAKTDAALPVQPTLYTAGVNAVQHSRFAAHISFQRSSEQVPSVLVSGTGTGSEPDGTNTDAEPDPYDFFGAGQPPPPPAAAPEQAEEASSEEAPESAEENSDEDNLIYFEAPVVHFSDGEKNIAVDWPYGSGSIIMIADPYIVSNGGIGLADNVQFAVNVAGDGRVVFDEYHHGFGSEQNRFIEYFAGTPALAILLQVVGLGALVLFSRSRRFARPVPEPESDRLSKLEYVSAMAELQRRTRAYDLAMENIFTDFRRRVTRHFGVDNRQTSRTRLAELIAAKTGQNAEELTTLFATCEAIVHGEPTREREILELTGRIREIEEGLGIMRRGRSKLN